jgi:serine/threonine-protein kinase
MTNETFIADGRYRIERVLGRGGMGTVYLARQTALDRDVALKVISVDEGALAEQAVARFEQEMRVTARIEHPNTVRLYDSGSAAGRGLYLAMEYLPGRTLRALLDAEGALAPARAARIAQQIARALAAAHRERIVHRDLKPENVMLLDHFGEPDFVKVLDFGIARFLDAQTARMTQTGAVLGTPAYMSPEQAQGQEVDARADLYALGVMLYEMLGGRAPLLRDTALSTLMAHVNETPRPLAEVAPGAPPALADLVMALLEKSPERRPSDAASVATALGAFAGSDGGAGARPTPGPLQAAGGTAMLPTGTSTGTGRPTAGGTQLLPREGDGGAGGTRLLPDAGAGAGGRVGRDAAPADPPLTRRRRSRAPIAAALVAVVAAVAATPAVMRLMRGRQALLARAELDQAARARHEPLPPAGCSLCSPPDLTALVEAARAQASPAAALAALEGVSPACAERWTAAARARLAAGDARAAGEAAGRATELCPTYAAAHHLAGNAAMKAGDPERAAAAWQRAAALDAGFAAPRFNLALAALERKDPATAVALLSDVIAHDRAAPNAFLLRGRAHLAAGDRAAGEADLAEAVRQAPGNGEAWLLLGVARAGRDDAGARQAFCRARDLGRAEAAGRCPSP